jgi:hypothetical protein
MARAGTARYERILRPLVNGEKMVELTRAESLRLLGTVPFGRIVFTRQAMPAIRPVNRILDHGALIVRTLTRETDARQVPA